MSYFSTVNINSDTSSYDSFGRQRVSNATAEFDFQQTYDLSPLLFQQITAESGATIAHDTTNRCATMTFSSTPTGGKSFMQSYQHFRYQSGRSQMIFSSFCFIEAKANCLKFVGYSDGSNGCELQLNGSTLQVTLYSDSSLGDETVSQSNWNLDKMDGTGRSGITIDISKAQIFIVDFQSLYSGRVRCGFDINGLIYYFHEFDHANYTQYPFFQTSNLPVRCGMTCTGTVSTTMRFICCAVSSEGGIIDPFGYQFSAEGTGTAGNGTRAHLLSIRPKTTFNSIVNRSLIEVFHVDFLVTGNNPILYEIVLGQAISGTTAFNDVNTNYSAVEYNTLGTISGSPAIVIMSGYVSATSQNKGDLIAEIGARYPLTLDVDGAVRSMGTISVIVTGLGAASACRCIMEWKEIR